MKSFGGARYDLLLCAASFESHDSAIRMLNSVEKLGGRCLIVIAGPIITELEYIKTATKNIDRVLFVSPENSMYLCRDWGFIWAVHEGISARYMLSMDDDIEFKDESRGMIAEMDRVAADPKFSVLGFSSNSHHYSAWGGEVRDNLKVNPLFLDGNLIIAQWQDVMQFGLPDSLPHEPMSYFSEVEYECRLRHLTGRPIIGVVGKNYWYWHHHRSEPARLAKRVVSCAGGEYAGVNLWKEKYGMDMGSLIWDAKTCERGFKELFGKQEQMKRHVLFNGQWNDWAAIYDGIASGFVRIG